MITKSFDLIVLGGGSGGIASAVRAAKYGASVAVIEQNYLGGTCVNLGCVPKKIMYNAASIAETFEKAPDYGFSKVETKLDWLTLVQKRDAYIARLRDIYATRFTNLNITHLRGYGSFINANTIAVGAAHYQAAHIIIATGGKPSIPKTLKGIEFAITSDGFFALTSMPKKVAIVGSGYIGVELAGILQQLGCETHLLLRKALPLSHFDELLGETLLTIMRQKGLKTYPHHSVQSIVKDEENQLTLHCENGTQITKLDQVIMAIGRSPRTSQLHLDTIGVKRDKKGFIEVDRFQNTTTPGIYAIGDVIDAPPLTPVAIAAGRRLCDRLFGGKKNAYLDYENICSVVFSHPPVASVGLSEKNAIEKFGEQHIKVYQTKFNPMYDALSDEKTPTAMKLVTFGKDEKIIGLHIIGYHADEMIQGFGVAIKMGACKRDFDDTVAIHPTSSEELVTMV